MPGHENGRRSLARLLTLAAMLWAPPTAQAQPSSPQDVGAHDPLYLLTYDHGGVVLWGPDHFVKRLRDAVAWLDRYPHFKIGLDNEAYVYDYFAEKDKAVLEELRGLLERTWSASARRRTCTS